MAIILLPIMLVALVAGVAANYFQIGFLFTTEHSVEIRKIRSN